MSEKETPMGVGPGLGFSGMGLGMVEMAGEWVLCQQCQGFYNPNDPPACKKGVDRAVHNSPPPFDDVGSGVDPLDFDPLDPNRWELAEDGSGFPSAPDPDWEMEYPPTLPDFDPEDALPPEPALGLEDPPDLRFWDPELEPFPLPLPPNPKQQYGDKKVPLQLVPPALMIMAALGFREGARKYGAYNWRNKAVESQTYVGAALRHILAWQDGEELDPETGHSHLAHAIACLGILADALALKNLYDTRPPRGPAAALLQRYTQS